MFSNDYQTFPSGIRSPLHGEQKEVVGADREALELIELYRTQRANIDSWKFRYRVLKCVKRLFGPNFCEWLDAQDQNVDLSPTMYAFLEDLVGYIGTGKWKMPLSTYMTLIVHETQHDGDDNPQAARRSKKLSDQVRFDEHEYLSCWLNHPNGFDGMLCVINLLFGTKLR